MKASQLICKLNAMIDKYGDKDIRVVGCFTGSTHDFTINDDSEYWESCTIGPYSFSEAPDGCFFIDEVDSYNIKSGD